MIWTLLGQCKASNDILTRRYWIQFFTSLHVAVMQFLCVINKIAIHFASSINFAHKFGELIFDGVLFSVE